MSALGKIVLKPKGDYSASATYLQLDWVRYNGGVWVCKKTCTGQTPIEGEYWSYMVGSSQDSVLVFGRLITGSTTATLTSTDAIFEASATYTVKFYVSLENVQPISVVSKSIGHSSMNMTLEFEEQTEDMDIVAEFTKIDAGEPPVIGGLYDDSMTLLSTWEDSGIASDCAGSTSILNVRFPTCTTLVIDSSCSEIADGSFSGCSNLKNVTIPGTISSIGAGAFAGCTALQSVELMEGVTSIGYQSFVSCTSLTDVTLPNTLTSIGSTVFASCTSLQTIDLPNSITSIDSSVFTQCSALESITLPNGITSISPNLCGYCTSLSEIIIPEGVETIGYSAFSHTNIETVVLPDSLTEINNGAFSACDSLTHITIPENVVSIDSPFVVCEALTSVVFEDPNGWSIDDTPISSTELSNAETAAQLFISSEYGDSLWTKN